jgi:hypothetical protein
MNTRWTIPQKWFLLGCLPTRLLLVFLAGALPLSTVQSLHWIAWGPAIGFWFLFLTGLRPVGPETGNRPIWWNAIRPIHGTLWGLFAYEAGQGSPVAWRWLALDLVLGILAFTWHVVSPFSVNSINS